MFSYPFLTYSLGLTPIHWAFNTLKLHVTNTRPFFLNYFLFFYMLYSTFCPLPFFLSQIIFPPSPPPPPNWWVSALHMSFTSALGFPHSLLSATLAFGSKAPLAFTSSQPALTCLWAMGRNLWAELTAPHCLFCSLTSSPFSFSEQRIEKQSKKSFSWLRVYTLILFSSGTFDSPLILSGAPLYAISESYKICSI